MITKEKNFIIYETEKGAYKFDINTATLYGVKGKPIKNLPKGFKENFLDNFYEKCSNDRTGLEKFLQGVFENWIGYNLKITDKELTSYYKLLDKIDSLNIRLCSIDRKFLNLINKHFKQTIKIYNNGDNDNVIEIAIELEKEEILSKMPKALLEDKELKNLICKLAIDNYYTIEQCKIISSLMLHNPYTFSMFKSIDDYTNELKYDKYNLTRTLDYFFEMANAINYTINKKDSFTKQFFEMQESIKIFRKSQDDNIYNSVYAKRADVLNYCNDKFIVIIPKNKDDFIDESKQQHNCIFRLYYPKVRNNKTYIVFVRKADSPTKSYITCEIDKQGKIVQYLRTFNENIRSEEDINFKNEYQKHLLENWKQRGITTPSLSLFSRASPRSREEFLVFTRVSIFCCGLY